MKRSQLVTQLTYAVATSLNYNNSPRAPEDRHAFTLIRSAIEHALPKGAVVAVLTETQVRALMVAAQQALQS